MQSYSFDHILDQFIGFGKYQLQTFANSCALSCNFGNLALLLSLLLKLYKQELDITMNKVILLAVVHRIGNALAGIFVMKFNNILGRIKIIKYSLIVLALAQITASIAEKYFIILFVFLFQGYMHGICAQYSQLLTIEVIPKNNRGQIAALVNLFHGIGSGYPILLWYLFCEDFENGNHKAIHFCNAILTISIYFYLKKYGRDNPRYYLSMGRFSECFYEIDHILKENKCTYFDKLNNQQKDALILWYSENFSETKQKKSQISTLFTKNNARITIYVISIQIIYYAATSIQQYLLPFIYHDKQKGFESLFFQQVGIIPAVFIQSFFIDSPTFGRAKSGMIISILLCITYLLIFYQQDTYISQQVVVRFLLEIQFTVMQIMINESFNSNLRALGLSFTYVVAKISQLLSPVIIFKLYETQIFLPFLFCGCLFLVNGILYATFPRERTKKALDLDLSESLSQSKRSDSEY